MTNLQDTIHQSLIDALASRGQSAYAVIAELGLVTQAVAEAVQKQLDVGGWAAAAKGRQAVPLAKTIEHALTAALSSHAQIASGVIHELQHVTAEIAQAVQAQLDADTAARPSARVR